MSARRVRDNRDAALAEGAANNDGGVLGGHALIRRPLNRNWIRLMGILVLLSTLYLFFYAVLPSKGPRLPDQRQKQPVAAKYTRRIVAVGDLHSDYDNALNVLHMAGVVDRNGNWTGNVDYFVQTGDIIDRADDTIKLYVWMEKLREQAHAAGGEVFSHLGNHEYMNALGDWRYVRETEIDTFGSIADRQLELSSGFIGSSWARNYSVASRVPLHPAAGAPFSDYSPSPGSGSGSASMLTHAALSFMHGGLSPTFQYATPYPSAINKLGASLLRRAQTRKPQPLPHPPGPYVGLPPGTTSAEDALYESNGPLWYRGWATDDERTVCGRVDKVIQKIGVRRLIMGHTPNFEKIVPRCGGKIIIIDTGISKAYGGVLSALSITYTLSPVAASLDVSPAQDGAQHTFETPVLNSTAKGTGRWTEREEVMAIYPWGRESIVQDERVITGEFW